jgi:hypothetical protein
MPIRPQVLDVVAGVDVLCLSMEGLQAARLPEGNVIPQVQLQVLKNFYASHGEIRFQVGRVSPANGTDGTGVHSRSFAGNLAALQQCHIVAVLRQMVGR